MTPNRPTSRPPAGALLMRAIALAVALLFILVPACGAVEIARENIDYYDQVSESYTLSQRDSGVLSIDPIKIMFTGGIEYFDNFDTLYLGGLPPGACLQNPELYPSASTPFTVESGELSGRLHYNVHFKNGQPFSLQIWVTFDKFEPVGSGPRDYVLIYDKEAVHNLRLAGTRATNLPSTPYAAFRTNNWETGHPPFAGSYIAISNKKFEHELVLTEYDHEYVLEVFRHNYKSRIELRDDAYDYLQIPDEGVQDFRREIPKLTLKAPIYLNITDLYGKEFNRVFLASEPTPDDPDNIPVVVYVKSTQTGALLADAQIVVKDTTTAPWSEVVNQTLPSGYVTITLAKDPGFDPTQYQISVKVPGYQQVVPTHFFRVTGPMSVVVEMEPLEGGPVDEDNTFLDFYVTDLNGNPVSNAQVYVGGQLRWTNAQGYTQFEVAKNTSYSYDVSKSGYVTVRGSATVGDGPRYTVNVVLGPETDPTEPPVTDPGTSPVNVYVKSSQTGALLADARVIIKDTTTDPWSEVVNQTLPSGHGAVSLAKDPGFNPTQYQISVTVPDYQQVVPALFFRVTGPTNVVVEMEPIEGGPVDENNTFLEFYVRDLNGNGISNAQVYVGGQLRWTNAQGWIQFEVPKNASYPYTVSKSGYVTIEGTATVGDGPRYTVNVVLGPKTEPTEPPGPGVPTPPGGIPDEDDDSDGFMMESVRGIANLFGVSFGVGKTILGMLLALGIGTATAKHLRGGAQEFGMGMLGGVVLGVLIGLLPIWVLVLLVLIVGLWIGQRYMSGGDS